jgi:hypothetical protein
MECAAPAQHKARDRKPLVMVERLAQTIFRSRPNMERLHQNHHLVPRPNGSKLGPFVLQ